MSRDSSVSTVTGYGLNDQGSFPGKKRQFTPRQHVHPVILGIKDSLYGSKGRGAWIWTLTSVYYL